jgi:hypothetical protein
MITGQVPKLRSRSWQGPLYHVGAMLGQPTKVDSQQGHLLCCSPCPDDWIHIAKLGGLPTWQVKKAGKIRLFDAVRITPELRNQIFVAAARDGMIEAKTLYRSYVTSEDPEDNNERFSLFDSPQEAQENCEEGQEIEPGPGWISTRKLSKYWLNDPNRPVSLAMVEDAAITWTCQQQEHMDGVWWNYVLDPEDYSAPIIGIFPDKIQQVDHERHIIRLRP